MPTGDAYSNFQVFTQQPLSKHGEYFDMLINYLAHQMSAVYPTDNEIRH